MNAKQEEKEDKVRSKRRSSGRIELWLEIANGRNAPRRRPVNRRRFDCYLLERPLAGRVGIAPTEDRHLF
jgi:hypothetical protein